MYNIISLKSNETQDRYKRLYVAAMEFLSEEERLKLKTKKIRIRIDYDEVGI